MRRIISALAIILLGATAATLAWPAEPGTLTSLREIHALSNAEASRGLPVAFEGVVTYYDRSDVNLFVEDQAAAIYVETAINQDIAPGDRVLVRGKTQASFRPEIVGDRITVIGKGPLPDAREAEFDQMIRGELDCMRVKVHATVASADIVAFQGQRSIYMRLRVEGGYIGAAVFSTDVAMTRQLRNAYVEVTGLVAGKFDNKNQLTGILLEVGSLADIKILKPANYTPESLPITPMDQVLAGYHVLDQSRLVRVQGTVTYFEPGSVAVLQSGDKSIWITTRSEEPLRIGDVADATGFPDINGELLALTNGVIRDTGVASPILPSPVSQTEMASGSYARDLVSIEGKVLAQVREAAQDEYVLTTNGQVFSAIYHRSAPMAGQHPQPMRGPPIGATVRVTGISMVNYGSNPFQLSQGPVSFSLLLRSADDIQIVAKPSWRTVQNLTSLLAVLVLILVAFGVRHWLLDRKLHRQTLAVAAGSEAEAALERRMAQLEQRRSRILENINKSRPLAEIIEQITELVSFTLNGSPCRCEIAGAAPLGQLWTDSAYKHILRREIISHSGLVLGVLSAALDEQNQALPDENEALAVGTQLATLAIETRRVYSDLIYRSKFDLLTDSHNRFSLEENLDALIGLACQNARIFGLVYIDLDKFKSINDHYGHHVGDAYLQEAATRMARQLRADDLLARVGGDEFVVLLPAVHSHAEVAEIAQRLERSFADPLYADGHVLHGSASVGFALYPEDGATRDSILKAADAAMYVSKQTKDINA
jgi:diguanylate cyclase (GGDEF)-like protein